MEKHNKIFSSALIVLAYIFGTFTILSLAGEFWDINYWIIDFTNTSFTDFFNQYASTI